MSGSSLRVAAIQLCTEPGRVEENLEHASLMVERACAAGARMVILPEFAPIGYTLTEQLWESAEPRGGPVAQKLQALAARFGTFLGTTILEAEGEHFYNTFLLATPQGDVAGFVRKTPPASAEAAFFRTGGGPHLIECALGRMGVQICYEVLLHERLLEAWHDRVDILVQSAAAAYEYPTLPGDHERYAQMVKAIGSHHALALGVPVLCANRCGPAIPGLPPQSVSNTGYFGGRSAIVDADGSVLAMADDRNEAVLVADIHPGTGTRPESAPEACRSMWALPVPWFAERWPVTQHGAEMLYANSQRRRQRALQISGQQAW